MMELDYITCLESILANKPSLDEIMGILPECCLSQGAHEARERIKESPVTDEDRQRVMSLTIETAMRRWYTAIDLIRAHEVADVPSGAFIAMLGTIALESKDRFLERAVIDHIDVMIAEAKDNLVLENPVPVPDIDSYDGDDRKLMFECMNLLSKLGTFHMDRRKYETDEQRTLHDRITAICRHLTKPR